MKLVRERRNTSNLTRYYRSEDLSDATTILRLISDVRAIEKLSISYILLSNLMNREDGDIGSLKLPGEVSYENLANEVMDKSIDAVSMYGEYAGKPIVIGANLNRLEVFITIRMNNKADIDALQDVLMHMRDQ